MSGSVASARCTATTVTSLVPGAIAVITLSGDVEPILARLTRVASWPVGSVRHLVVAEIDDPLILRPSERVALLTPHGGPRIVSELLVQLESCGATLMPADELDPRDLYPEATDEHEADALALIANADSPLVIPLLLDQPPRWRVAAEKALQPNEEDLTRSRRLDRLVHAPRVAIVGPPNAGKSTLLNRLVGRTVAIAHDTPGTTRDHVAARVDLAGLVVDLVDTPGLRATDDRVEIAALELSSMVVADADLIVALAAPGQAWPTIDATGRPVLRIASQSDRGAREDADLAISAVADSNIEAFAALVRDTLVPPADREHPGPWWPAARRRR